MLTKEEKDLVSKLNQDVQEKIYNVVQKYNPEIKKAEYGTGKSYDNKEQSTKEIFKRLDKLGKLQNDCTEELAPIKIQYNAELDKIIRTKEKDIEYLEHMKERF